jgi:hypothetical protein
MKRATAIVITSITSFVVFMIFVSSPYEVSQSDGMSGSSSRACVAKVTTDAIL